MIGAACVCWAVNCAFTGNPTGRQHIQIAEPLWAVPWRFGGLKLMDPWFVYCIWLIKSYDVEISGNKFGTFSLCFPRGMYQDWVKVLKWIFFFFQTFENFYIEEVKDSFFLLWKYVENLVNKLTFSVRKLNKDFSLLYTFILSSFHLCKILLKTWLTEIFIWFGKKI